VFVPGAFAFLGRHATKFMAAGVLLGLAVPPLASLAHPLLVPALLIPLTLALLRLDWRAIGAYRHRPGVVLALIGWLLVASPLAVWLVVQPLTTLGLPPSLAQALVLMAAASPIVSSVALALFLGLDATLAIVAVLLTTALVPLTLPPLALALTGVELQLSLAAFMLRLALLVGGAFAAAWLVRRVVSPAALARRHELIDGLSVVTLVVFAVAIMDGVTAFALARPGYVAAALAAAFAFNLMLQAAGYFAFRRLGTRAALTAGLVSGNCNMGLVLVALQDRADFEIVAFFALAQIPMYTLPALLAPVYQRIVAADRRKAV
jgi:BASS family bile acid:Na+ symporter